MRYALVWSAVALLHLLLWAGLTQPPARLSTHERPAHETPVRVTLRMLPAPRPTDPAERDAPSPRRAMAPRAADRRAFVPARAAAASLDATAPGPQPITVATEPPQAAASQPPLDLSWHAPTNRTPGTARSPATTDPRGNSARATLSDRMAHTLGSDSRLTEEARADGTVRLRQGSACVDLKTSRAAQLFPFDQSTRSSPRLAEACD